MIDLSEVRKESSSTMFGSGAHPGVGGVGDVPCSGDLLLGALAACQEITIRMVASAMGIQLEALAGSPQSHDAQAPEPRLDPGKKPDGRMT